MANHRRHLVADASGDDHQVGLPRRAAEHLCAESGDIKPRRGHRHHLDRATSQPERHRPDGVFPRPVDGIAERGGHDSLGEQALLEAGVINASEQVGWAAGQWLFFHNAIFSHTRSAHTEPRA